MFERVEHARLGTIEVPGLPLKLGGAETASRTPCPGLGQHTEEVLREVLGYDAARIASLREAGAIA
jgi:succinate--hydroxymethylglutarate CoA-transferase